VPVLSDALMQFVEEETAYFTCNDDPGLKLRSCPPNRKTTIDCWRFINIDCYCSFTVITSQYFVLPRRRGDLHADKHTQTNTSQYPRRRN